MTGKTMLKQPPKKISVVVATYNGATFLEEQLSSILNQSRAPDEIIISDDNSSDGSRAIIEDFSRQCPFPVIPIFNVPGLGFADNFMAAASRASGDVVAFCDQDDIWHPDKIATCLPWFDDPAVAMVAHRADLIDTHGAVIGIFDQDIGQTRTRAPLSYDPWGTYWGFSMMFRRDIIDVSRKIVRFKDYINPSHSISHDRWITFLAQMLGSIVELEDRLVSYRQHATNLYGARMAAGTRETRTQMIAKSARYVDATQRMAQIVDELDARSEALFPLFDRAASRRFVNHAMHQQEARFHTYRLGPVGALVRIAKDLLKGRYRAAHDGRVRYRSALRDVQIALARRSE